MDRKLDHILAGVAVGRPVKQGHRLVHFGAVQHKMPEQGGVALGVGHTLVLVQRDKDLFRNGVGVRAGQPHHRDAALPGGRGQSTDRIAQQHPKISFLARNSPRIDRRG